MGRNGRRARGQKRRQFVLEEEDLRPDDEADETRERSRPEPSVEKINLDPEEWRREFARKYKPKPEKQKREFDYDNPKPTEEEED